MSSPLSPKRLAAIAVLLVAGVFTGAQLGKIAPIVGWYEAELGLSLVAIGWLTAILGIFVALAALPAGVWIGRTSGLTSIGLGSAFMVAGGLWLAFAGGPAALFSARIVEAVGYCILCIALPAILTRISPGSWQGPVLAVWSGFVPVGFASADFIALSLLPVIDPSAYLALMTMAYAVFAVIGLALLPGLEPPVSGEVDTETSSPMTRPILLLGAGFGAFVVSSVALFSFLPAFAASGDTLLLGAGAIVLTVPLGNVIAGVLVGGRGAVGVVAIAVAAFLASAATALFAFSGTAPLVATLAAVGLCVASGIVASAIFAATPLATRNGISVAAALGLVCQAGGIATLAGPPAGAFVIETTGWTGFGMFLAAVSLAGAVALLPFLVGRLSAPADAPRGP
jgi:MFS family permease